MIKFYVEQIKLGKITIDDVPTVFRKKVKAELKKAEVDE